MDGATLSKCHKVPWPHALNRNVSLANAWIVLDWHCAQPLYAFKSLAMPRNGCITMRCRLFFRSLLANILYASPAWCMGLCEFIRQTTTRSIYESLRSSQFLSPRRFHRGSASCRSGWRLVCICFIERSARSSLYFAWTQYSFVQS